MHFHSPLRVGERSDRQRVRPEVADPMINLAIQVRGIGARLIARHLLTLTLTLTLPLTLTLTLSPPGRGDSHYSAASILRLRFWLAAPRARTGLRNCPV